MIPLPRFDADGIRLYCADAHDVVAGLADGSVDLILTDPPYGLDARYGRSELGKRGIAGDDSPAELIWIAREASRLLAPDRWLVEFCGYNHLGDVLAALAEVGLTLKTVIVWDKTLPGLGEGIRNQHEFVVLARKGSPPETYAGGNVWSVPREGGRPPHPHAKPLGLICRLLDYYSAPGQLVLDPFTGGGSTLRGCYDLGRHAIGIEIDPAYCQLAAERLGQLALPFAAAMTEAPTYEQLELVAV